MSRFAQGDADRITDTEDFVMAGKKRTAGKAKGEADQPPRNPRATESLMADAGQVRLRAHQIFRARMAAGAPGDSLSDWLQAEREIRERWS